MRFDYKNSDSLFAFLSLIVIYIGMILDQLSTRTALIWFPEKLFEGNNWVLYLMTNDLWIPVDIALSFLMWVFSIGLYIATIESMDNKFISWIVGGSIPLVYGGTRLMAGIHNIQLILRCIGEMA